MMFLLLSGYCFGWGKDGHRIVNRVAIQMLPTDIPKFLRGRHALDEIEYLGPEPDRWRSGEEANLEEASAPEHFIDLELADLAAPVGLPERRFDFLRQLSNAETRRPGSAPRLTPQSVGLLPWQADECFERLQTDMHEYRARVAAHRSLDGSEQAILYDAGLLGHYVADGSQPLHTTVNYNGWVEMPNPEGFTSSRGIHSQFETEFVHDNLHAADVSALVPAASRLLVSPFEDFLDYLRETHRQVTQVYRLEKQGGFTGSGTAESRSFTAERLAAGASMLRDMIYTAWVRSAAGSPVSLR